MARCCADNSSAVASPVDVFDSSLTRRACAFNASALRIASSLSAEDGSVFTVCCELLRRCCAEPGFKINPSALPKTAPATKPNTKSKGLYPGSYWGTS